MTFKTLFTPARVSDADAVDLYGWFAVPRLASAAIALWVTWVLHTTGTLQFDPRPLAAVIVPAVVVLSVAGWIAIRRGFYPRILLQTQSYLDLAAVIAGIAYTGGARSPFLPMCILVVYSAGVVSSAAGTVIGFVAIVFCSLLALPGHSLIGVGGVLSTEELLGFYVFVCIVALTAFQSRYFVARLLDKDEDVLKLKDEFIFRTVHDVRSPATIIKLVFNKYDSPEYRTTLPDFASDAAAVNRSLDRIDSLVSDILHLGEDDSKAFEIMRVPVDMRVLVLEVALGLAPAFVNKRIAFQYEQNEPVMVIGDPARLRAALENLIGNAVKYNRPDGAITVSHHATERGIETEVADTGIGISEKSLQKLFAPYFRGDIGAEIPGTGLGLYSTKKVLERMGGTITARSVKEVGTTFTVTMPAAKHTTTVIT